MPAHIGIQSTLGLTAPEGGYAHETSAENSAEVVTNKNDQGVTVFADPKPYTKRTVSMKGVGAANFALVASGGFQPGELKILSAKGMEENEKRAEFEYSGVLYLNAA
jgi:hypothetical protein